MLVAHNNKQFIKILKQMKRIIFSIFLSWKAY